MQLTPPAPQMIRDGSRLLKFLGWRVAAVTSARPGVQRWSELTLYRMRSGEYLVEKVGRSTIAHRPGCSKVTHRMPSWLDAHEEAKVHRTPCFECSPEVGDLMDPHTRLEPQRFTAVPARSLSDLADLLVPDGKTVPPLVMRLLLAGREFESEHG